MRFEKKIFGVFLFYFFNQLFSSRMSIVYWWQELYSKLLITMFVFIVANKDATKSIVHLGPIFCFFMSNIYFRTNWFSSDNYLSNIFPSKSLWWNTYLQETMKNTDLRIHGGTSCCSMSILTVRLEEVVGQGEIMDIYILLCIYWNKYQKR